MGLERYHEKRDFAVSPEPKGKRAKRAGFSYVIQKHAARNLHYDFRLELGGVLLSWAVPKGPSLDPKVKRLAMQTEDHPVEYGSFEGTIPKGEYGGGTVMVWDRGTWSPLEDPNEGYAKGHLRFELHGKKLHGVWHLVRTGRRNDAKRSWLLFKSQDSEAKTGDRLLDERPNSAQTGRSMAQIAEAEDSVWHSNRAPANGAATQKADREPELASLLKRAKRARLPRAIEPEWPTAAKRAPTGDAWGYELDYEGHRLLARLHEGKVKVMSGQGADWTKKFPGLARSVAKLPFETALLDGTIAVQRPNGTTDMGLLDETLRDKSEEDTTYFVFDVLHLDGYDLRRLPLRDRKSILELALEASDDARLTYSPIFATDGKTFVESACKLEVASVVAKKLDRPYRAGKSRDWLTIACEKQDAPEPRAATPTSRLTHPDRVLYPREKITKRELADYYAAVSEWMLPHVAGRPLTLVRCPEGIEGQRFFQKHAKPPLAKGIRAISIDDDGTPGQYMAIDDVTGILALVQMSVLEIHTWGAHADDPEKPDALVFDLDPDPTVAWGAVVDGAKLVRRVLHELGLESWVKTTGGKGLHVCAPIARRVSWDQAKEFTRAVSELIVGTNPKAYTATMSKAQRHGKIFIDFFRNTRGASFIAPYSTRARPGAPVAVPLAWDELSPKIRADHFDIRSAMQRLRRLGEDPWKDASSKKQSLSAAALRSVARRGK
jgi:bifunctional non-homologous end joining protein LigD